MNPIVHEILGASAAILLTAIAVQIKAIAKRNHPKIEKISALLDALDLKLISDLKQDGMITLIGDAAREFATDQKFSTQEILELIPEVEKRWSMSIFAKRLGAGKPN